MKTKNDGNKTGRKIETTEVKIAVAKDPENRTGLRGLKGLVFAEFAKAKDLKNLPTMEDLTEKISAQFPQSRWIARPKVHYSYYKSKFLQQAKTK